METHIVYLVTIHRKEFPNKYIGSKSNCGYKDGLLLDKKNKEYWGSSKDALYKELLQTYNKTIEVLYQTNNYDECLKYEKSIHICLDIVANIEYFNKSIATLSTYHKPGYGTYKHTSTNQIVRLPCIHSKVLSGEWVGVTKGKDVRSTLTAEQHEQRSKRSKAANRQRLLTTTQEERKTWSKKAAVSYKQHRLTDPLFDTEQKTKRAENSKRTHTGRVFSNTQKANMSRVSKNKVTLHNIHTQQSKRFDRGSQEYQELDKAIWITNFSRATKEGRTPKKQCEWCSIICSITNYSRWHGTSCKQNPTK